MSLITDLSNEYLTDPTVRHALEMYRQDPALDEYTTLIALVRSLVQNKQQIVQEAIAYRNMTVNPINLKELP